MGCARRIIRVDMLDFPYTGATIPDTLKTPYHSCQALTRPFSGPSTSPPCAMSSISIPLLSSKINFDRPVYYVYALPKLFMQNHILSLLTSISVSLSDFQPCLAIVLIGRTCSTVRFNKAKATGGEDHEGSHLITNPIRTVRRITENTPSGLVERFGR